MINVKKVAKMNLLTTTNFYKIYSVIASPQFDLPDITRLKNPSNVSYYRSADMSVDQYKIFYDNAGYPSHLLNMVVKKFKRSLFLLRIDYIHKLEKYSDSNSIEHCFNDIIMILENPSLPYFYSTGSPEPYSSCINAFCSGVHNYISELRGIFRALRLICEITENDWQLIKNKLAILEKKYGVNWTEISSRYMDPALAKCIRNSQFGLVLGPICTVDEIDEDVLVRSNPAMPICLRKTTAEDFIKIAGIKKVVYNYPATIVWWWDGSKTIVKVHKGEKFNKEMGLAMAIAKKVFGNMTGSRAAFKKVVNTAQDHSKIDLHLYRRPDSHNGYLVCSINRADAQKLADAWVCINPDEHGYMMSYAGVPVKFRANPQETSVSQMKSIIAGYNESKAIVNDLNKMDGDTQ